MSTTQSLKPHFKNIRKVVCSQIEQAEHTIYAAVAWFTDDYIFAALLEAAKKKGISIEILIMDDDINQNSGLDYAKLENAGIAFYSYPSELDLMHHKFCMIDNKTLLMGSYNWTRKASRSNSESLIVQAVVPIAEADFRAEFDQLKAKCHRKYHTNPTTSQPVFAETIRTRRTFVYTENSLPSVSFHAACMRARIFLLEMEVSQLEAEKTTNLTIVEDFERRIRLAVGDLLLHYKELETKLAELYANLTGKRQDQEAYAEKAQTFQQFKAQLKDEKENPKPQLDATETDDIKQLYRAAVMLAHPDKYVGDDELMAEATTLMARLGEAYKEKDLKTVREIHEALQNGTAFRTEWTRSDDVARLEAMLTKLQKKRLDLIAENQAFTNSETWLTIQANPDTSAYATQIRAQLEQQIISLKKEIQQL
jgi:PLD-like domain